MIKKSLKGKSVVVGVTGGIAAYKSVELISRLRKLGAEVDVLMTESATKFVSPLTFQTISNNEVITDLFSVPKEWDVKHISIACKLDLFVIAPATANTIGKIACGIADDVLSTVIAAVAPHKVVVAPAMNTAMYKNPIVKENITKLKNKGYTIIEPETGQLACGDIGKGRLANLDVIIEEIVHKMTLEQDLMNLKFLITAGPTREYLDPVRYITNRSSGKMGYAMAEAAADRGAQVVLVSGPVGIEVPKGAIRLVNVTTAEEMYDAVLNEYINADVIIKAAAVSDYAPDIKVSKIKKTEKEINLRLNKTKDILNELGRIKGDKILVGFAAETEDLLENAKKKLSEKNLDLIVANDIMVEGAGFDVDTNIAKIIDRDGNITQTPLVKKKRLAHIILDQINTYYKKLRKE